jgi:hypothetical protein
MIPVRVEAEGARGARGRPPAARPEVRDEDARPGDLVCAACGRRITHEDHRIEVGGGHEHTFVNPGGFVHVVGCFAFATGLSYVGAPETAFSWFPGWSWQIAACLGCGVHLGWIYRSTGDQFHGLLTARLARR